MSRKHSAALVKSRMRKALTGGARGGGFLRRLVIYLLLIGVGFVFLYPLLRFLSTSFKDMYDLVDPMIDWVPSHLELDNYAKAFRVMGGWKTLWDTLLNMGLVALAQTVSSALVGYGFAKYDFWGKRVLLVVLIATFFVPDQVSMLPKYVQYSSYHMTGTILPFLLPSLLGHGLKNALFILIYYQFFRMAPKSLDEAASIDGAGQFTIFARINLRMAAPATVIVAIFSLVWNWNETNLADTYLGTKLTTIPLALQRFSETYARLFPRADATDIGAMLNLGIETAGTILSILPLVLLYAVFERQLIESIDRAGITGE